MTVTRRGAVLHAIVTDASFDVMALDGTIVREGTLMIRATRVAMNSPSPFEKLTIAAGKSARRTPSARSGD